MPVENFTYLSALDANNPITSDGLSQGDDHLRGIKTALKNTFPNWTATALNATQAALDAAVAAVTGVGTQLMAAASGIVVAGDTDTGMYSPGEDQLNFKTNALDRLKIKADGSLEALGNVTVDGALAVTGALSGPGTVPIGGTVMWWSDTLPVGNGAWTWLNGGTYLRSNTALFNILGTSFGVGDGTTTAGLPDLRDNVPVGKGTMGGVSAAGRVTNFVSTTLGTMWGECLHLLGITELPAVTPAGTITLGGTGNGSVVGGGTSAVGSGGALGIIAPATLAMTATFAGTPFGGGQTHNNIQPSVVCNWIMRIA